MIKKVTTIFQSFNSNGSTKNWALSNSFELSKQREFAAYISSAKRAETRQARLQKIIPLILNKIGLNDKYRK